MILTTKTGHEVRFVEYSMFDFDMNDTKDFKIQMPSELYAKDLGSGARVFKEDTEYGGIIGGIGTQPADGMVNIFGRTWRGVLDKKVIEPPSGQDYRVVSGDVGTITNELLRLEKLDKLFRCHETGVTVSNFKFDRYCTLYAGLIKLYASVNLKMALRYVRGERGDAGYVLIEPQAIIDYSEVTQITTNNEVYFSIDARTDRVNHLICLGKGELKDRTVIHLYLQANGTVGTKPYYTGVNDVTEIYDYSSVESSTELREKGTEKLLEETNYQTMNMEVGTTEFKALIGDIVGGRDYITDISMKQPITNVIYREENGIEEIHYVVDGDIAVSYDL